MFFPTEEVGIFPQMKISNSHKSKQGKPDKNQQTLF